jgi:hypothetical protein
MRSKSLSPSPITPWRRSRLPLVAYPALLCLACLTSYVSAGQAGAASHHPPLQPGGTGLDAGPADDPNHRPGHGPHRPPAHPATADASSPHDAHHARATRLADQHLPASAHVARAEAPDHADHADHPVRANLPTASVILVLVPLIGVVLGVGLYAALRSLGALNVPGTEPAAGGAAPSWRTREQRYDPPSNLAERVTSMRPGCLVAIMVATGVWILGWLIVLAIGLSLLS